RMPAINQLFDGDIAIKHVNGACFRVEQAAEEQARADSFEISPTAPLFGTKVMLAEGQPGMNEVTQLNANGFTLESWQLGQGLTMPGERRALRVPLTEVRIVAVGEHFLTLSFALPKGSYATSVLREIIK
ncbi:MAG: tRNA pseudouridine(13) synthase TruD, partial [Deltaproteobacteria bacterium]|nr:tRNA pseudouridine(13) synthase TruD [Deltaproteobacteria bacterium]